MSAETVIVSSALPVGYVLNGTYTISSVLGQGGFGITYLATELTTQRQVVIKENYPTQLAYREPGQYRVGPAGSGVETTYQAALQSFIHEAGVLTRLNHCHIAQVLTAFQALGTAYYVMDYIGGRALNEVAPSPQNITEKWLLSVLQPLLSALQYLHTLPKPLLHRDIKPNNILLLPDGTPVLIDFGLARESESGPTSLLAAFTPGYSPLEQNIRAKRGPWTDLYALGATCYFLLTRETPPDCHERTDDDPYRPLSQRPELSGRFSTAVLEGIDRALRMPRHERWQTAQAWLDSLHGKEPHGEVVSGCKSRPRRGKAVFAAALLLLAAVGTVSYYQGRSAAQSVSGTMSPENRESLIREVDQLVAAKHYDSLVERLTPLAEQGYAPAQMRLGACYFHGYGVTRDLPRAVEYFRKAAELGNTEAQKELGNCYYNGQGVPQDYAQAVSWYRKAAELGNAKAQNNLGHCCRDGHGVPQDYAQAVSWFRKAAEKGLDAAWNNLGWCYEYGHGVPQDYEQAVSRYRKAAELGYAVAQYNLGLCYQNGRGVPQDYAQAVQWYRKAAEQGNVAAQEALRRLGQ